jgi:hypothetical protein
MIIGVRRLQFPGIMKFLYLLNIYNIKIQVNFFLFIVHGKNLFDMLLTNTNLEIFLFLYFNISCLEKIFLLLFFSF